MPRLSQLKTERLRNAMEVVIAGREEIIEIYNPMDKLRDELVQMLLDNEDVEDTELGKKLYTKLFNECTNIEVDTDLDEMLNTSADDDCDCDCCHNDDCCCEDSCDCGDSCNCGSECHHK